MHAHLDRASAAIAALADSPLAAYALAALAIAIGFLLWFRGHRAPRWTSSLIGAIALGSLGWTLATLLGSGAPAAHPWQGLLAGAALGAAIGFLARGYILTTACAATGCAIALIVAACFVAHPQPEANDAPIARFTLQPPDAEIPSPPTASPAPGQAASAASLDESTIRSIIDRVRTSPNSMGREAAAASTSAHGKLTSILTDGGHAEILAPIASAHPTSLPVTDALRSLSPDESRTAPDPASTGSGDQAATSPESHPMLQEAWRHLDPAATRAAQTWSTLNSTQRGTLAGAAAIGLAAGAIVGACAASLAAAILSSLLGAALWIAGSASILATITTTAHHIHDRTPPQWAIIWAAAAAIGVALQAAGMAITRHRHRPRPAR
jgi:hypothetical protein